MRKIIFHKDKKYHLNMEEKVYVFDSSAFLFQGTVNQINSSVYTGNGLQLFALVEYAFPVFLSAW